VRENTYASLLYEEERDKQREGRRGEGFLFLTS
jgi:hypothetical protein